MHPEDVAYGWKIRIVQLGRAQQPANHNTTITTYNKSSAYPATIEVVQNASLVCDTCGEAINNGDPCVAITMYRGVEPPAWEQEFGAI